jgi:hypothetical protein
MLMAALPAAVYVALIAMHVLAIRGGSPAGERYRPRVATWLASRDERRRARTETAATRRLIAGPLDRDAYRAAMAAAAAQDALAHPVEVPKTKM